VFETDYELQIQWKATLPADQAPHAARAEEIAAQVNLPVQAPAQQPGEIQPAAGAQQVLQANEVRYYFCSGLNVTLLGLFKSLV